MPFISDKQGTVLIFTNNFRILNLAKNRLKESNIEVFTASNQDAANRLLIKNNIDIAIANIISDAQAGREFLSLAMLQNPDMERVVLCDDGSKGIEVLTDGIATSFIADPWGSDNLKRTISSILEMRNRDSENSISNLIDKVETLPAQSDIYNELMEALNKRTSFRDIALIVKKDVAISTNILRVANTKRNVNSIEKAITMILGSITLKNIVMSYKNAELILWSDYQREQLKRISAHSYIVDKYFSELYKMRYNAELPENYHSIALLHDIGKIVQIQYLPFRFEEIMANMQRKGLSYCESEADLGMKHYSHTEIGARILEKWNFPKEIVQIARMHHNIKHCANKLQFLTETFELTDALANYSFEKMGDKYFTMSEFYRDHKLPDRKIECLTKRMIIEQKEYLQRAS